MPAKETRDAMRRVLSMVKCVWLFEFKLVVGSPRSLSLTLVEDGE